MNIQQFDVDDEAEIDAMFGDLPAPAFHDELGVLSSTRPVVELGDLAWINREGVQALQEQLRTFAQRAHPPTWDTRYHFFDGTERTVNWVLLLDALNFCFWAEKGQPRWSIVYKGETLNGYWAEAAALRRAVEEGYALWDARYLSDISSADLAAIFRGAPAAGTSGNHPATPPVEIPLFEQRLTNTREVGRVLLERFDGQFIHVLEEARGSAVALALLLAEHFPSFRDMASFRGQEVRFLKRAQICAADLRAAFGGRKWGAFTDLDQLTVFADYKLPQLLRHWGVLEYAPRLAERIDREELLEAGSAEEVQIRAATVWAGELLRQTMSAAAAARATTRVAPTIDEPLTAADIDAQLWLLSQQVTNMRPYHRVRTIYY